MFCSTSLTVHLLRGIVALALIVSAMILSSEAMIFSASAVVAAIVLLRGCPMCWLIGLFETIRR
jgi:hypothetical protein